MGNSMKREEVQVIIEGRPASGKSSALFRLKNGEMLLTPTPGGEGFFVESLSLAEATLNVWELHSASIKGKCMSTARALCFVVDCKEGPAGLEQAKTELHEIMSTFASQESRRCFAVLVLANKQDLDKAMTPAQLERALGIGNRADSNTWNWRVQGCSATEGLGLREGMDWLATVARNKNPLQTRGSCGWVATNVPSTVPRRR